MSLNRFIEWVDFAQRVTHHVLDYTIPQYGDKPNDQLSSWTVDDCLTAIRKYSHRIGRNARGPTNDLLDCIKIAHYAAVAHAKLEERILHPPAKGGDEAV